MERFAKKKGAKKQASKFIIDYINFPDKRDEEIIDVVEKTLNNRDWLEKLIVIKGNKLIKIYKKAK